MSYAGLTIGVLAVQGGFAEHQRMVEQLGASAVLVRRVEHLSSIDGLILPGGESTTMSKLLDLSGMLEPLRSALQNGLPAFGTCAGLILLASEVRDTRADAHSLGVLDIAVRRNAFGRQADSFETTVPFTDIDGEVEAVFIRAPQVEDLGPGVESMSELSDGTIVGVRQGNVIGTSFHPELSADTRVHEYFLQLVSGVIGVS